MQLLAFYNIGQNRVYKNEKEKEKKKNDKGKKKEK